MTMILYDGSYEGFYSAVFEIYEYKIADPFIQKGDMVNGSLFGHTHTTITSAQKSARVYNKLKDKISRNALHQVYSTFLSGEKKVENVLFSYIQYAINSRTAVENDYSNTDVLMVQQMSRKVHREKHRMEAFVRFQLTRDKLYYSIIQPDFNVLPLISKHFEDRYADQCWLIYDITRKYGIYYNLDRVEEVEIHFNPDTGNSDSLHVINDEKEELYQKLWQQYFSSVNIDARKNMKLHIQHMPKRYWKYLVEKKG
ncbi:MAG: TIGR03915 family putative DNA repair protein [Ferruginibacter sp.]